MCFSAGASFTGGTMIAAIGIATLRKVNNPSQKLFASIPVLFSVQQFSEGILWLTLRNGGYDRLQNAATYIFLLFALIIWPTFVPLSVIKMEKPGPRKTILKFLLATGIIVSSYYAFCMLTFVVQPGIRDFHIEYRNNFPETLSVPAFIFYAIATIIPLFVSGVRKMYIFGLLVLISCIITGIFYKEYLTSVWCFFAALISSVIYYIVSREQYVSEAERIQYQGG